MITSSLCCFSCVPDSHRAIWCLTYACNRQCRLCVNRRRPLVGERASPATAREVATILAQLGYNDILLTGGEPLARDDFFDIAAAFNERGFALAISTNGDFLTRRVVHNLSRFSVRSVNLGCFLDNTTSGPRRPRSPGWLSFLEAIRLSASGGWRTRVTCVLGSWDLSKIAMTAEEFGKAGATLISFSWPAPDITRMKCGMGDIETNLPASVDIAFNRIRFADSDAKWGECPAQEHGYLQIGPDLGIVSCVMSVSDWPEGDEWPLTIHTPGVIGIIRERMTSLKRPACRATPRMATLGDSHALS